MSVISFQGLCFFRTKDQDPDGSVTLYMPFADSNATHQDGGRARAHFPAVFVSSGLVKSPKGFRQRSWVNADGRVFRGEVCQLGQSGGGSFQITIEDQDGGIENLEELKERLPSFSEFAPALDGAFEGSAASATLKIKEGHFAFRSGPTDLGDWKIDAAEGGPLSLGTVPWSVDWTLDRPLRSWIEIKVRDEDGDEVASIKVKGSEAKPSEIIIGSLDHLNPASWPDRQPDQDCQDDRGHSKSISADAPMTCYDNDFKWFYRLYSRAAVHQLLADRGPRLPVPYREGVGSLDTPTCFPGID